MATVIINSKEDADMVTAGMTEVTMNEFYDVVGPLDVIFQDGRYKGLPRRVRERLLEKEILPKQELPPRDQER